jgi:hypothetical protein
MYVTNVVPTAPTSAPVPRPTEEDDDEAPTTGGASVIMVRRPATTTRTNDRDLVRSDRFLTLTMDAIFY